MVFKKLFGGGDKAAARANSQAGSDTAGQIAGKQGGKNTSAQAAAKKRGAGKTSTKNNKAASKHEPKQQAWTLAQFEVAEAEGKVRFHDFDLPETLMHAIADLGYQYCSPIQAQSLPHTLKGKDLVGKAQTGTGKTAAFLVSTIYDLMSHPLEEERYLGEARALVIAPTRELVMQIAEDAKALCTYTGLTVHTLVGGMDYQKQKQRLHREFVDILVATPGRLMDFYSSNDVYLDRIECLVIDEADRMLDMGFIPQVKRIIRATPKREHRQTLLFSATFTQDVLNLAEQWTYNALTIEIEPESVATDRVDQKVYMATRDEKFKVLYNILNSDGVESAIVFANRRDTVRRIHEKLQRYDVRCGVLSGEIAQQKRTKTLENFKQGKLKVLVATDVAGRGIHIDGISHVVNYTLPEDPEDYVHRIGRTGRAGATGVSISFADEEDGFLLPEIEALLGQKLKCEQTPELLLKALPAKQSAK